MRIAARAPNHLGDGVLALPAIAALARLGSVEVYAPGWGRDLYRDLPVTVRPRGALAPADAAVLFPPSLRAAIEARWCRRRIGTATDHRRWLLTDVVAEGPHRFDTYRALAQAVGARVDGPPRWSSREDDPEVSVPPWHIGLNPVSVSGAAREWPGFADLARTVQRSVVVYGGPGEQTRVAAVAAGRTVVAGLSLPAFARALRSCALFVSNDSGAAHFARACGVPTLVVYGSTAPERTGPLGAHVVRGPPVPCGPCTRSICREPPSSRHRCFRIPVDQVSAAIGAVLGG